MRKFSIIVPYKIMNANVVNLVQVITSYKRDLTWDFELILVPNFETDERDFSNDRLFVLSSGDWGPGFKRDLGAQISTGEYLVFIDDDAYPGPTYFQTLNSFIDNTGALAVAGPNVTPENAPAFATISGLSFSYKLTNPFYYRYIPVNGLEVVRDMPTVNLCISRDKYIEMGGFNSNVWPGDDTYICDKLRRSRINILYCPELVVYHQRRPTLKSHLVQIWNYASTRGQFIACLEDTERNLAFFLPTILLLAIVFLTVSMVFFDPYVFFFLLFVYILTTFFALIDRPMAPLFKAFLGIHLSYINIITYGISFPIGFLSGLLKLRGGRLELKRC